MYLRIIFLSVVFFYQDYAYSQKALFWDKKSNKTVKIRPETLENFSIRDKEVIYEKVYVKNTDENFINKYYNSLKNENHLKNLKILNNEIYGNLNELYISGPNAEGIITNDSDFENFSIGKKINIKAGVKGWQMFYMSALYGEFKIQFKEDKYRVIIKNMWMKDINSENFDLEYWVLASDKLRFADEFFNLKKSKRSENYNRAIRGFNLFLEEKFRFNYELPVNNDW